MMVQECFIMACFTMYEWMGMNGNGWDGMGCDGMGCDGIGRLDGHDQEGERKFLLSTYFMIGTKGLEGVTYVTLLPY